MWFLLLAGVVRSLISLFLARNRVSDTVPAITSIGRPVRPQTAPRHADQLMEFSLDCNLEEIEPLLSDIFLIGLQQPSRGLDRVPQEWFHVSQLATGGYKRATKRVHTGASHQKEWVSRNVRTK